jgi:hypothetical protein
MTIRERISELESPDSGRAPTEQIAQYRRLLDLVEAVEKIRPEASDYWLNTYSPRKEVDEWSAMNAALTALRENGDI